MNAKRLFMLLLVAVMLLLVTPLGTQAADYSVCRTLNGYAMQPADTQTLISLFGYLPCGTYWIEFDYLWWIDKGGSWHPIGSVEQQKLTGPPYDPCTDPIYLYLDYIPPGC